MRWRLHAWSPTAIPTRSPLPGLVTVEVRIDEASCDRLASRGHRIERVVDWTH